MVTWKLKSCPRCTGDMFVDRDENGWYEQCLLCCYRRSLNGTSGAVPHGFELEPRPKEDKITRSYKKMGRPSVTDSPGFRLRYKKILERLSTGDISRREAAKELGIGYATLKRLLDTPV